VCRWVLRPENLNFKGVSGGRWGEGVSPWRGKKGSRGWVCTGRRVRTGTRVIVVDMACGCHCWMDPSLNYWGDYVVNRAEKESEAGLRHREH